MPTRTGPLLDEDTSLLGRGEGRTRGKRSRADKGVSCNRLLIAFLVVIIVVLSILYQQEVNDLTTQLQSSQQSIQQITQTLGDHASVIDRFNSSVTNADVISQLSGLQSTLNQTAAYLENQLVSVKQEVSSQLDNTVQELSQTVKQAEQEISDEVDKVKKDVEHYVITTQDQFSMENSFMVYQLAGTFTLLSCLISMWHMTAHLRKMNQPDVQRKILAILWMSPIYAITSWFSLVFHSAEGYLAIIKDGYEAYIIYQFLSFCIAVIGRGDRDAVVDVLARHADHLTPPFRLFGCFEICGCCKPPPFPDNRALADAILLQCQGFAMQFVLFRPLTTTAMVVLKKLDYYGNGDGPTDYRSPQFYITIVQNISIFVAFTGLLKFYHAVDKELAWCRPLAKFLCIKGVVFMTFWQGLCISILAQTTDVAGNDKEEWAMSAQNFLICLEMLLFSIAHFYCFPTEEWQEGYRIKAERAQFGDTIALGDFFQDVKLILTSGGKPDNQSNKSKHRRRRRKSSLLGISSRSITSAEAVASPSPHNNRQTVLAGNTVDGKMQKCEAPLIPMVNDVEQPNEGEESTALKAAVAVSGLTQFGNDSGTEEDDDDLSSENTGTMSEEDLDDGQRLVKHALNEALGAAGDDPDVVEATKRLLESKVLSPDFFQGSDTFEIPAGVYGSFAVSHDVSGEDDYDSSGGEEDESSDEEDGESDFHDAAQEQTHPEVKPLEATEKTCEDVVPVSQAENAGAPSKAPKESSDSLVVPQHAHEHESKLGSEEDYSASAYQEGLDFLATSNPTENLKPSIFTTIADIDKKTKQQEKEEEVED